jgi:hypothetical protein
MLPFPCNSSGYSCWLCITGKSIPLPFTPKHTEMDHKYDINLLLAYPTLYSICIAMVRLRYSKIEVTTSIWIIEELY